MKKTKIVKKIIVASNNKIKINATLLGFKKMFPRQVLDVCGKSAPSGVSDQPIDDKETYQGALNRVNNLSKQYPFVDFCVGIESGIKMIGKELEVFSWIVVKSKDNKIGKAKTVSFFLPEKVAKLVREGMELGKADDIVFGRSNTKETVGAVGLLTNNIINREKTYIDAVILALIPFKNREMYF